MSGCTTQTKPQAHAGPFTVYAFKTIRTDAHVERDGQHFMTVNSHGGAGRLATILNDAVALAEDNGAIGNTAEFSREKIVHAVARALGCKLVFDAGAGA